MIRENLIKLLDGMELGDNFNLISNTHTLGLKYEEIFEQDFIVFGGYGLGLLVWDVEIISSETIVNDIEKFIKTLIVTDINDEIIDRNFLLSDITEIERIA